MGFQPHSSSNLYGDALNLIKKVEQTSQFDGKVHNAGDHLPTLGYGYALVVRGNNGQWVVNSDYVNDFETAGILALSDSQNGELKKIANYLNDSNTTAADTEVANLRSGPDAIPEITVTQAENLFRPVYDRKLGTVESRLKTLLGATDGAALYASLANSWELIVLGSLAYGNANLIGRNLANALNDGNRAEAWYQIRYESNADLVQAKRRYYESEAFGLYNPGVSAQNLPRAEAEQIMQMFTRHRLSIFQYEQTYGEAASNNRRAAAESDYAVNISTLDEALNSARQFIIKHYVEDLNQGLNTAFDGNVLVGNDQPFTHYVSGSAVIESVNDTTTLDGTAKNDLILGLGGKDTLTGGAGNDILIGGAGKDTLIGGTGNDTYILGGAGESVISDNDVIVEAAGEGTDLVISYVDNVTLAANVENLTLADGPIVNTLIRTGRGNDLDNIIKGSAAQDQLYGGWGSDTLEGGDNNDTLSGDQMSDTLTGGSGDDVLYGGNDSDILYGDLADTASTQVAYNDQLHGGKGADILYGGGGNDLIDGGQDTDFLYGGAGFDTYRHLAGEGKDILFDSDGQGAIQFNAETLTGGKGDGKTWWQSNNKHITYSLIDGDINSEGTLLITGLVQAMGSITVEHFHNGDLGIQLDKDDEQPARNPASKSAADAATQVPHTPPRRDPLILDLDGDGLETVGINATTPIRFDHDADGIKTATGWVKADDAFLVLDRNTNGTIDNGRELFGDATYKTDTTLAADGFDALSALDTNGDGDINSADAKFADLRLWRDLNQDGISQSGELFTLADQNIASIHLGKTANSVVLANGNQIADLGSYARTDGSEALMGETSTLGDVNLIQDNFNTSFSTHLDTTTVSNLADMQGSGQVRDLREAANADIWRVVA